MTVTSVQPEVRRDRFERPYIMLPDGSREVPYTRCTTYIDCLESRWDLERWKTRMTAIGLSHRSDLQLAVVAHRENKDKMNEITEQAMEAAKSKAKATIGTALHELCAQYDLSGREPLDIPEEFRADIAAYREATARFKYSHVERLMVLDHLKVAGTPDRILTYKGKHYIGDLKTGDTLDYGAAKIAMQLAVYSRSTVYDVAAKERVATPIIELDKGIVIHAPQGSGTCTLYWVDLIAGWRGVQLAGHVRKWRTADKKDGFMVPVDGEVPDPIAVLIAQATTVDGLTELWRAHRESWTAAHSALAADRKSVLTAIGG